MWRLSEYGMYDRSHTVHRLPVHLPNQQNVYFKEGTEQEALKKAQAQNTKLTAWFQLNCSDPQARVLKYTEIPQQYVFNERAKKWQQRRARNPSIIRMYSVSPNDEERFFLRLLLLHVPGARNFKELRTVEGVEAPTFKDACKLLRLLEDDSMWDATLQEAEVSKMPNQLRFLFATILALNQPRDPHILWANHKESMAQDFCRHFPTECAEQHALHHIDNILKQYGELHFLKD